MLPCIVVFHIIYQFLSHIARITIKLQSSTIDIIKAYDEINDVKSVYASLRGEFHKVYQQAERMGASVNVTPSRPRNCGRQQHRPNVPQDSIEEWYRVNVAIPFLDHVITELDSQFSSLSLTCSCLLNLVPPVMCSNTSFDSAELLRLYGWMAKKLEKSLSKQLKYTNHIDAYFMSSK